MEKFKVIQLRLLSLIDFYLTIREVYLWKRTYLLALRARTYSHKRTVLFKRVTTGIIDSAVLPFCVACQNIILKKYQTDLTVTLIENGIKLKAAVSKSSHWKIHKHLKEVVTIHKNHNHKKLFLGLHFRSNTFLLSQFPIKNYSESSVSAEVIVPKKWIILHFRPTLKLIITHHHLSKFVVFLKHSTKTFFFSDINRQVNFYIIWNVNLLGFHSSKKLFYFWKDMFSNRTHTKK